MTFLVQQAEKLSRSDEQSAFLTGGNSIVEKFSFFYRRTEKTIFLFKFRDQSRFFNPQVPMRYRKAHKTPEFKSYYKKKTDFL
jgi:hypothetical protein